MRKKHTDGYQYKFKERKAGPVAKTLRILLLLFFIGLGFKYGAEGKLELDGPFLKVSSSSSSVSSSKFIGANYLTSPYVYKLPQGWGQPNNVVKVYATQQCIRGPIKNMRNQLPNVQFYPVDLNAVRAESDSFQAILRAIKPKRVVLPAYVVRGYIVFNNNDAAQQIKEILAL